MNTFRPLYFLLLLLMGSFGATGQRTLVKGYLRDSITHYPIVNGTITNWKTQKSTTSNKEGFFFIEATSGDPLFVKAADYENDTLHLASLFADTLTVYLSPSGSILPGVTVRASYTKYQLDSMRRKEDFDAIRGNVSKTINDPPTTGVGVNIGLDKAWSKKEKQKVKAEKEFQKTEKQMYVDYRFSPQLVSYYTGLKADALRDFMHRYTPSYDWLRKHTAEQDVLLYINDKLKLFKKGANNKS